MEPPISPSRLEDLLHQRLAGLEPQEHAVGASSEQGTLEGCYSIKHEFQGADVLLTGATGFVGSVVLEKLLRQTDVHRVYVLARGKRSLSAQDRVKRLLHTGLFHMVRDNQALLDKVHVLEGDMSAPRLGIKPADLQAVLPNIHYVIHCAASIELEAEVTSTLKHNYLGTEQLLQLAIDMPNLRALVHTSSAYTNVNRPRGSSVKEQIYPLCLGGEQVISHHEVVEDLLSLGQQSLVEAANVRAQTYMDNWHFPNSYTLGKHLAEHMVADYHAKGLPVAIVRPSLVSGLATAPYPGYAGNITGPLGMALAQGIGLFDGINSVALESTHVWDVIPGDRVASAILATAAAMSAGLTIGGCGAKGTAAGPTTAATPATGTKSTPTARSGASSFSGLAESFAPAPAAGPAMTRKWTVPSAEPSPRGGLPAMNELKFRIDSRSSAPPEDAVQQEQQQAQEQQKQPLLVVHACTTTIYPLSYLETQRSFADFFEKHPSPFKLPGADTTFKMPFDYQPNVKLVNRAKRKTAFKVAITLWVLRKLGQHRTARRLHYGHVSWAIQNSAKTDKGLFYQTDHLLELDNKMLPEEAEEFPVLWTAKHGGWFRYTRTIMAAMYKAVFGIDAVGDHDFKHIKDVVPPASADQTCIPDAGVDIMAGGFTGEPCPERDVIEQGAKVMMTAMATVPADSAKEKELPPALERTPTDSTGMGRTITKTLGRTLSGVRTP